MVYRLFCFILFISIARPVYSQANPEKWLQVSLGPSLLNRQDLIFSPFVHTNLSLLNGGLEFHKRKNGHQFLRLQYNGFTAGLKTPYDYQLDGETHTAFPHSFTFVQLGYGRGWFIGKKDKDKTVLGLSLLMDVQAMNYEYGRFSFFGYYSTTALGAWYQHSLRHTEKSKVSAMVNLPLVSWMARSPYLINDDEFIENTFSHNGLATFFDYLEDGHLATWNEWQSVEISLQYQYDISQNWSLGAGWKFSFIHAALPKDLYSVQNNLSVVALLKL